jgi:hypothetical protein
MAEAIRAQVLAKAEVDIAADGVCIVMTETTDTPYAYTVGLEHTWNHPELVIVGVPSDTAHMLLWRATQNFIAKKQPLLTGTCVDKATLEMSCDLRVHLPTTMPIHKLFNSHTSDIAVSVARFYYEEHPLPKGRALRILQLLWPSATGTWPDAVGADSTLQRVL